MSKASLPPAAVHPRRPSPNAPPRPAPLHRLAAASIIATSGIIRRKMMVIIETDPGNARIAACCSTMPNNAA